MMTERAAVFFLSGTRLCLHTELFEFSGPFRDEAHKSFIIGGIRVRGGVFKSTLVVDNDRQCTMLIHAQLLSVP